MSTTAPTVALVVDTPAVQLQPLISLLQAGKLPFQLVTTNLASKASSILLVSMEIAKNKSSFSLSSDGMSETILDNLVQFSLESSISTGRVSMELVEEKKAFHKHS